jgi:hypothetical protein|tara:strand:+ start:175 stop:1164 length:990 start_codon:yes stop_codon:yes gene_type:complete
MATNFTSTSQGGQREDLANWISNISRDMTPFVSSIGKGKASATLHEWSTDTLEAASVQAAAEGASFAESASPVVARVTNRTQILTKGIRVSGTLEAVDKVGRKSEFKYQTEKRGKEMARDLEVIMLSGQVSAVHGSSATGNIQALARKMGAYQAYSTVNIVAGTAAAATGTGSATGAGDGSNIAVAQSGHTNALVSLADINETLRLVNGVTSVAPNKLMMSTTNKVRFSDLMTGTTNVRRNIDEKGKLKQSVDLYESDFGDVELVHNYLMGNTEIFVYDPSTMSINTLRPLHFRDISEDGDSLRSFMVQELTFEAKTPTGNAVILDVTA